MSLALCYSKYKLPVRIKDRFLKHMGNLKVIFVFFLFFSAVYASYDCSHSSCGKNRFDIRFPFGLQGQKNLQYCSYPGFNLTCNNQGRTVLNLPGAGDFYIRDIDYLTQQIQLYDPDDCLPKRLLDFHSSSSTFKAVLYQNYTFLTCSTDEIMSRYNVIGCLSNSTISTLATPSMSLASSMPLLYNCTVIRTLPVPVSSISETSVYDTIFSTDLNSDLVFTWDEPNCQDCEEKQSLCGFKNATTGEIQCFDSPETGSSRGLVIFRIVALALVVPAITCSLGVTCYVCFEHSRYSRQAAAAVRNSGTAAVAPQPAITTGLDDSTIESYTKVVLGESRRVPGPNHITCPICLADYHPKETVRSIPECEHCFHAECIDEWLRINGTCPVCRNNPSPSHVNSS